MKTKTKSLLMSLLTFASLTITACSNSGGGSNKDASRGDDFHYDVENDIYSIKPLLITNGADYGHSVSSRLEEEDVRNYIHNANAFSDGDSNNVTAKFKYSKRWFDRTGKYYIDQLNDEENSYIYVNSFYDYNKEEYVIFDGKGLGIFSSYTFKIGDAFESMEAHNLTEELLDNMKTKAKTINEYTSLSFMLHTFDSGYPSLIEVQYCCETGEGEEYWRILDFEVGNMFCVAEQYMLFEGSNKTLLYITEYSYDNAFSCLI